MKFEQTGALCSNSEAVRWHAGPFSNSAPVIYLCSALMYQRVELYNGGSRPFNAFVELRSGDSLVCCALWDFGAVTHWHAASWLDYAATQTRDAHRHFLLNSSTLPCGVLCFQFVLALPHSFGLLFQTCWTPMLRST